MQSLTKKQRNRRYYLHRMVKKHFRCNASQKAVFVPYDYPDTNKYVAELRDTFRYNIQTEIS